MPEKNKIYDVNRKNQTDKNKSGSGLRVMIENVVPEIDGGRVPIKRIVGENVVVRANIFADGHDEIVSELLFRGVNEKNWQVTYMKPLGNDLWIGSFTIETEIEYIYCIRCYIDEYNTWFLALEKKIDAGQDISIDLKIGIEILEKLKKRIKMQKTVNTISGCIEQINAEEDPEKLLSVLKGERILNAFRDNPDHDKAVFYEKILQVNVDRKLAQFSSWYELFPRSWSPESGCHGSFKDCERLLPEISRMGFDIIYLPPIHPIGKTNRKGANNSVICKKDEPGCPWAIGAEEGGHKSIHTELGGIDDFRNFIEKAREYKLEIALDLAYQCSPDHPYIKDHPEWFRWRPDGTVQYAENPPKKYEDVISINFETEDMENLWRELKSIVLFWIEQGISIFRVDNPHTKPFVFWDWLISEVRKEYPRVIFLAEAFTRPNIMNRLAKSGFNQSYTYFTWRTTKKEFIDYLTELTATEAVDYYRPNFWTNTPDILSWHLQNGGRPAFIMRAVLAGTLSSNYGIYGPVFELCVSEAMPGKEEYIDSEKYEIRNWDWNKEGNIKDIIARLNSIRRENPALQLTRNIRFCETDNDHLLGYYKATADYSNIILVVVNLDPYHTQTGTIYLPTDELGIEKGKQFEVQDLLNEEKYTWNGQTNYIELNPQRSPAHILRLEKDYCRENEFDYFM